MVNTQSSKRESQIQAFYDSNTSTGCVDNWSVFAMDSALAPLPFRTNDEMGPVADVSREVLRNKSDLVP